MLGPLRKSITVNTEDMRIFNVAESREVTLSDENAAGTPDSDTHTNRAVHSLNSRVSFAAMHSQ